MKRLRNEGRGGGCGKTNQTLQHMAGKKREYRRVYIRSCFRVQRSTPVRKKNALSPTLRGIRSGHKKGKGPIVGKKILLDALTSKRKGTVSKRRGESQNNGKKKEQGVEQEGCRGCLVSRVLST